MSQAVPTVSHFKQLCLSLRNADPRAWEQFVSCFDVYTIEVMSQMATAPSETILNMQGRAQQCKALLQVFATCHIPPRQPQQPKAPTTEWAP